MDLLIYFLFWLVLIFYVDRFLTKINPHKILTITLWAVAGLITIDGGLIASNRDNLFYIKRPFDIDIMETGYKFGWQHAERPNHNKYHPEDKNE